MSDSKCPIVLCRLMYPCTTEPPAMGGEGGGEKGEETSEGLREGGKARGTNAAHHLIAMQHSQIAGPSPSGRIVAPSARCHCHCHCHLHRRPTPCCPWTTQARRHRPIPSRFPTAWAPGGSWGRDRRRHSSRHRRRSSGKRGELGGGSGNPCPYG